MMILVNGNVYSGPESVAKNLIDLAKGSMKGKNAILALIKDDKQEMLKDTFDNKKNLMKKVLKYEKLGFKVIYVAKGRQ